MMKPRFVAEGLPLCIPTCIIAITREISMYAFVFFNFGTAAITRMSMALVIAALVSLSCIEAIRSNT